MRSKVHPKYKTKYRVGNWSAYEQALVQRGDVTLWLSADATDAWRPSPSGRPGAPKTFSDCAIETALTLRLVFRLPLRQAEGFLRSVLSLMGVDLAAPDHTTLSRRSQSLAVEFRRIPSRGPMQRRQSFDGRPAHGDADRHLDVPALSECSQAVSDLDDAGTLHERDSGSECRPSRVLQTKVEHISETVAVGLQEQGGHGRECTRRQHRLTSYFGNDTLLQ